MKKAMKDKLTMVEEARILLCTNIWEINCFKLVNNLHQRQTKQKPYFQICISVEHWHANKHSRTREVDRLHRRSIRGKTTYNEQFGMSITN